MITPDYAYLFTINMLYMYSKNQLFSLYIGFSKTQWVYIHHNYCWINGRYFWAPILKFPVQEVFWRLVHTYVKRLHLCLHLCHLSFPFSVVIKNQNYINITRINVSEYFPCTKLWSCWTTIMHGDHMQALIPLSSS